MRTNVTGIMFTNTLGILIIYCLTGTLVLPATAFSPNPVTVNNSAGFQAAAQYLLQGLDTSVDPCQDFYKFTCNKYIKNNPEGSLVFGKLQNEVFEKIATQVSSISSSSSLTEQIFARGYQSCILNHNNPKKDLSHQINNQILSQLGGIPMLTPGWKAPSWDTLWQTLGLWESQYGVPSIFRAVVKVDQKNNTRHALYINQINVDKDLFVNIENLARLEDYRKSTIDFVQRYNHLIGSPVSDVSIDTAVTNSMKFQNSLALAMVPNELLRNYEQQYNPYNLSSLSSSYRNIRWKSYLTGLLKDVDKNFHQDKYIVVQPSYLSVVDSMIEGQRIDQQIIADFVGIKMLHHYSDFLGPEFREMKKKMGRYSTKSPKQQPLYTQDTLYCVSFMLGYMPFGAGYIYVAQQKERDAIALDVTRQTDLILDSFINMTHSLSWLDQYSMQHVVDKRNNIVMNVGWPYWFNFTNTSYMDNTFHRHYHDIMNIDINDFFQMKNALSRSLKITKNLGLLEQAPDRRSFSESPATVNAYYDSLQNSITFLLALLNPPMYRHDFPQSFNYGAQGSISGHEIVHGFDDSGIQFGPTGELSDCTWDRCGWMDTNSTLGFINMAQCVISQYSENCCPLKTGNVRCANGINTQGENIADLGGTQAAYKAYRKYIEVDRHGVEEGRLPGLEQFTPNQIFWIAHGFVFCSTKTDKGIENDLLYNNHSPDQCRINQVVRDIPEFGKDFNCRVSTPMYPRDDERCKVWTDAPLV